MLRIMLDTNILISALVFKSKPLKTLITLLATKHSLVLCSYVINEFHEVINRKFLGKSIDIERFLLELPFEFVYTPQILPHHNLFTIRDKDDEKVLYSAIIADVDVLITGDNDFMVIDIERPKILTPSDFLKEYNK